MSQFGHGDCRWADLGGRVEETLRAMPWRGPDDHGVQQHGTAAIGMSRLRVRSAVGERVPFCGTGAEAYAFNGEVYAAGPAGAVIPVAGGLAEARYAFGAHEGVVDGMWAVAGFAGTGIVDLRRDPWGIKPLWIRQLQGEVIACSELQALGHAVGTPAPEVRTDAVAQLLLFGSVLDGGSFWRDVFPLPPGGRVRLQNGRAKFLEEKVPAHTPEVSASSIEGALSSSVRSVLQSDRPLGVAVSGGLDSTIVALHVQDAGIEDLATVSVTPHGTDDGVGDLRQLRLPHGPHQRWEHHHVTIKPLGFLAGLREFTEAAGAPTSLTSAPLYLALAQAAADAGVVVLLVGEGADELFGGYRSYLPITSTTTPSDFYLDRHRCELVEMLVGPTAQQGAVAAFEERVRGTGSGPAGVVVHERTLSLGPLLERTDVAMMSRSIEARTPFLHGDVPDLAAALSWCQNAGAGQTKIALRAAYAERLPAFADEVKVPFRAPWMRWLSEDLRAEVEAVLHEGSPWLEALGINTIAVRTVLQAALIGDRVAAGLCFTLCSCVFWSQDQHRRRMERA